MVPYPEGALDESGRVRCGGDAIGFWERNCSGQARRRVGEMGKRRSGEAEKRARVSFKCLSLCSVDFQNQFGKLSTKAQSNNSSSNQSNFAVAL